MSLECLMLCAKYCKVCFLWMMFTGDLSGTRLIRESLRLGKIYASAKLRQDGDHMAASFRGLVAAHDIGKRPGWTGAIARVLQKGARHAVAVR